MFNNVHTPNSYFNTRFSTLCILLNYVIFKSSPFSFLFHHSVHLALLKNFHLVSTPAVKNNQLHYQLNIEALYLCLQTD